MRSWQHFSNVSWLSFPKRNQAERLYGGVFAEVGAEQSAPPLNVAVIIDRSQFLQTIVECDSDRRIV